MNSNVVPAKKIAMQSYSSDATQISARSFPSLAEAVRLALRKPASRLRRGLWFLGAGAALVSTPPVSAVELPQPCVGACRTSTTANIGFVTSGAATASSSGNTLTVNQSTENVTLNWQSFNISADGKVIFSQPSTNSIALNRIFQENPSQIFGSIKTQLNSDASKSGGQIYLVNPNGFVFGANSSVNAAGILVSTLGISDKIFENGLLSSLSDNTAALASDGRTVVQGLDANGVYQDLYFDSSGNAVPKDTPGATTLPVELIVKSGAHMTADSGGRILLASQSVDNAGALSASDGQIILAAGDKVYLAASKDDSLRGLLVEVAAGGTAWNKLTGSLQADRGNITIVGLAVNQDGRISASTSVSENGSVRLLGRDSIDAATRQSDTANVPISWLSSRNGTVTLGANSTIDVSADVSDTATAVDDQKQLAPDVFITGKQIVMKDGAHITAHGGNLTMTASAIPTTSTDPTILSGTDVDARIRIDAGATIDLSGTDAVRSVADNIVSVELRGTELADSPDQRNGALRGKTVTVDARVGTAIADVSGGIAGIQKTIAQRTSKGGTATFVSTGDIVTAKDANIDVSGGTTTYTGAMVSTSQLITADGKLVDIGSAKEDVTYVGVASPTATIKHDRWGVVEKVGQQTGSHYEAGYVQGSSAGTVKFNAPSLVLNGALLGNVVNGAYQRDPTAKYASGDLIMAQGGQLIIGTSNDGTNLHAPSITLQTDSANVIVADDASVPSDTALTLSTDFLTSGGFTRTELYSNDTVTLADETSLSLLAGSSLIIRAGQVNIDSSITAQSGKLDFAAVKTTNFQTGGGVSVADNVKLDVSGTWINDTEVDNSARPTSTLFQNAGSISLAASAIDSTLDIGDNAQFIANGGAWLKSAGTVSGGKGGSIALLSNGQQSSFALGDNVGLQAYGVNNAAGGTFTLAAGRIQLAAGSEWAAAQTYAPDAVDSSEFFTLGSSLFTDHGFSKFNLTASGGTTAAEGDALQVVAQPTINAVVSTLQLDSSLTGLHSGADVTNFSTVTTLPSYLRSNAASINLSVAPNALYAGISAGTLAIDSGVVISGDPGTSISLSSVNGSIDIQGSLLAKAGSISAHISALGTDQTPNDQNLQITIGEDALLDASGTSLTTPNDLALLQGKVMDGGSISVVADRGSVLIENGAELNVSGTSAALDIATGQSSQPFERQQVASNAGSINLAAAEAIGIYGDLEAHAGTGDTGLASGGTLTINLTRVNAEATDASVASSFPTNDRVVELTTDALPTATGALTNGLAILSVAQVQQAGVDDLRLSADDVVSFDAGVNLSLQRRLEVDAPALAIVGDGSVTLNAGYVSLGSSLTGATTATASDGGGLLNITAQSIDLSGSSAWQNMGTANLVSSGDIRLLGTGSSSLNGSLQLAGDLTLSAERVYAATATHFVVTASDSIDAVTGETVEHTVAIEQNGASPGTPLSAASSITINAANIKQDGTLLAPFGSLNLNATASLTLGAGSLTSVSGDDTLIPYGFTDGNGETWYYLSTNKVTDVPTRQITLNGDSVDIESDATIDLSGGGDLYAYEWVKGAGGTNDAFGFKQDSTGNATTTLTNPGLFAIIPSLGTQVAPYDAQNSTVVAALGLQAGDTVYLSGGGGLAAGYYTLLPARYALLPGAYLVTAASGFGSIQPGTTAALADGTPVIAGYRSFSDTGLGGTSYSGFAIYPGSWGRELAEYKDSYASTFFSDATRTTADAGQLSIISGNELIANGIVNSQAATGGQAATIDVSASNLEIVGAIGTGATGTVQIDDDVLNNWKAGRLLLGGSHSADGSTITIAADTVTIDGDAHLVGDEVALVARNQVAIDAGGSVQSNSAIANKAVSLPETSIIALTGEGADQAAFVAVSDIDNITLARDSSTATNSQGIVSIDADAQLTTRGQLTVDAPGGAVLDGTLGGAGASWSLGSSHIVFADDSSAGQLTITSDVLSAMQAARAVNLVSTGSIDFTHYASNTGNVISLGGSGSPLTAIGLQATAINNQSTTDSVELYADSISLHGVADATSVPAATAGSQGSLTLAAEKITIDDDALSINGFAQTNLNASQQVSVSDSGTLAAGGDLNIAAARITAAGSSNGVLAATGDVQLSQVSTTSSLPTLELGGALTISGNNVTDNAQIIAPSGIVSLSANNQLTLGSGAVINVAGVPVYAAGVRADSSGGAIKLSAGQDLTAAAGSTLSIAGSGDTDAGSVSVDAGGAADIKSTLNALSTATGGSFVLQADQLTDFASLNAALQTGGFTEKQSINVAHGDLTLAAGTQTTAHDVQLVTDDGAIMIAGTISAPSIDDRGSIRIYGADGVTLTSTAALHADGDTTSGRGGNIEIGISTDTTNHANARIDLQSDLQSGRHSVITADGAEQGSLLLRAPAINGDDIAIAALDADIAKVGQVTLEAVLPTTYDAATLASAKDDATAYIDAANGNIQARLNSKNNSNVVLSPGVEVTSEGDMDLDALDLSTWRFNGTTTAGVTTPVALTIRATGSINVNGTLSDGFKTTTTGAISKRYTYATDDFSATLRLVAGSDINSADPLAITTGADADIMLGDSVLVRTGTGDLSLVAARDVVFNSGSGVYTGGTNAIAQSVTTGTGASSSFLTNGGQLLISAGHDVLGYALADSVTAWQPRTGCVSACGSLTADQQLTSWGVDIRQFLWNVGTLGGGDLTITAGNDISSLSAAVADSAKETADKTAMTYYGGGSLDMKAGNNINSGMVYVGNSTGTIAAGGAVAASSAWAEVSGGTTDLGLLISMSDSQVSVDARNGIALAGIVNPTMIAQPNNSTSSVKQTYFYSYGEDSSVAVNSTTGDVVLDQTTLNYQPFFGDTSVSGSGSGDGVFSPANLNIQALTGSVSGATGVMYPSNTGQLTVFAGADINNFTAEMSDADIGTYTLLNPIFSDAAPGGNAGGIVTRQGSGGTPSAIHVGDLMPVSIVAGGDIVNSSFDVAKAILINAGRDIVNTTVIAQNVNADDVSEIIAGRDITYSTQAGQIAIGGAGQLVISAGRNIDLGTSFGITTTGSLNNANLDSDVGADVTLLAGMGANLDINGFIDEIVTKSATGSQALIDFVQTNTGQANLTLVEAVAAFKVLSVDLQRPFVLKQFFSELVLSGREATADASKGYSRGYTAIDALLPDSRSADSPYSGDISMLYSRIYTLSGGNITLFAPGGALNVGVAAKPLNSQFKEPGQLGVVAQGAGGVYIFTNNDVLVNSSRIFTLGGGDIAVWSTLGNIDAGKGAKTSLSIPPPSTTIDAQGNVTLNLTGAVSGSGIRTIQAGSTSAAGDVDLIAPAGFVNAGDAGIGSAGNINIAARQVIGADNINFSGNATGVPAETSGLAASLSGAAAVGGSSDSSAAKSVAEDARDTAEQKAPIAQAALSWLEVFVVGLGEENCKQDDVECLKRQK